MALLRRIQPACRLFGEGVVVVVVSSSPRRGNVVSSFRARRFSTALARRQHQKQHEQQSENRNEAASSDRGPAIDETTIRRLERLALIGFEYKQSKRVLEEAVAFAERLRTVQVDETVRPMYSTLENECIRLRDDVARDNVDRREILRNAAVLEEQEEYFVAPLVTSKERDSGS